MRDLKQIFDDLKPGQVIGWKPGENGPAGVTPAEVLIASGSVIDGASGSRPSVLGGHDGNAIASDIIAGVITGGGTDFRENVIGGQYDNVNTSTTNLPTVLGTVANYSSIEGGYDNVANGLMSVIHGAHNRTHQDSTHGAIGGGSSHSISDGDYGTIGGGLENELSGDSSTIVGGRENTVAAHNSVAGGFQNTIEAGADGSVALGTQNTVTVQGVAIGVDCDVEATSSTALGRRSRTRTYGQVAQAADYFASPGDAQSSVLTLRVQTTNATETVCGTTGAANSHILLASQVVGYRIMLVAREDATGDCKMWEIVGAMKRPASGNNTHVGGSAPTPTVIVEDAGASAWTCRMDISTNILVLRVTGEASHTIRWCARMELVEVGTF